MLAAIFTFSTALVSCRDTERDVDEIDLEDYNDNGMESTEDGFETTEDEFETTEDNNLDDEEVIMEDSTTTDTDGDI